MPSVNRKDSSMTSFICGKRSEYAQIGMDFLQRGDNMKKDEIAGRKRDVVKERKRIDQQHQTKILRKKKRR
jgi:hypothetical protein